jgi:hypothetical protein
MMHEEAITVGADSGTRIDVQRRSIVRLRRTSYGADLW